MTTDAYPYKIEAFGISDQGRVRQNNEDIWKTAPELHFYMLADGMGGHRAGEIAAQDTANGLCELIKTQTTRFQKQPFHDLRKNLSLAIQQVNNTIYKKSRLDPLCKGMGTTLCCIYFHPRGIAYAHVGDSRIYRLRRNKFEQITKDHSLCRELVDQGQLTEKEAPDFIYKNIITKAVGTEPTVDPSVHLSDIANDDLYLMCTDGLSDLLNLKEMQGILNQQLSLEETAKEFIATANARGGPDNITVVLMQVKLFNKEPI